MMKHSIKFKLFKVVSGIMAFLMIMSPLTAKAAEVEDTETVVFEKQLVVRHYASITTPTFTFKFNITPGAAVAPTPTNPQIFAGPAGATIADITMSNAEIQAGHGQVNKPVTIDFSNVTFNDVGIYRYIIDENTSSNGNPNIDGAIDYEPENNGRHYLDVYVVDNNGTLGIAYAIMFATLETPTIQIDPTTRRTTYVYTSTNKLDVFKNIYQTNNLTVEKHVTGNQGQKDIDFNVDIKLENGPGTGTFEMIKTAQGGTQTTTQVNFDASGTNNLTVALKHGESVVLYGLPKTVKYTVSEDLTNYPGYISQINGSNEVTMTEDRAVNVVNTRDAATPTGLFDDYGPFVILAVLAVGAGFVFFGKKKKETC